MRLAALQVAMSRYLVGERGEEFVATVNGHPGLDVYRNNYRGQLHACLRDTYEKCWAWLGDEAFDAAADAQIDRHAPQSWTLDAYGYDFERTLRVHYPHDPELPELAWLEWAMRRAFDGPDAAPFNPATLTEVDWDTARFIMVPTLTLGRMTTNAAAIWSALAEDIAPPPVMTLPEVATMLVWRQHLNPCFRTADETEARLLQLVLQGASFGDLCALLTTEIGADAATAKCGAILAQWISDGLIEKIV